MEKPFAETEDQKKMAINGRLYNDWYIDADKRRESYASRSMRRRRNVGLPPVLMLTGGDGFSRERRRSASRTS